MHDDEDEDNAHPGDGAGEPPDGKDADTEPDADTGNGHVNSTPRNAEASAVTHSDVPPWPFPTAGSVNITQADRHDA